MDGLFVFLCLQMRIKWVCLGIEHTPEKHFLRHAFTYMSKQSLDLFICSFARAVYSLAYGLDVVIISQFIQISPN